MISGGGTGGHIFPALAIANELKSRYPNAEFLFVGAKDRMEMEKVPSAGYAIEGLWISGIQRKLTFNNLLFPLKLMASMLRARKLIQQFKPNVVIGTGGFASGPLLYMAEKAGLPCLIQEQNSFPGITNKWLSKRAKTICVAYKGLERFFPAEKIVLTGNPIRKELLAGIENKVAAKDQLGVKHGRHTVLILGGSLGARRINQLIESRLEFFDDNKVELIWQCGSLYYSDYRRYNSMEHVQVHAFLDNMNVAYAAADIIISRAGASSVSELCVVGKPVVFIPSPNVAEDHQTKNAKAIADEGSALLIKETDLEENFDVEFSNLLGSKQKQEQLSEHIKKLAKPNATQEIVNEIEKLIQTKG